MQDAEVQPPSQALLDKEMPEEIYQYPPELMAALIEAIPLVCKSKRDVLSFFRGAGVDQRYIAGYEAALRQDREAAKKHPTTRELLTLVNERPGDEWLRVRREIVKRIVEFENFEQAWPQEQTAARGAVAKVRDIQHRKDSFTRMKDERDRERREYRAGLQRKIDKERQKAEQREKLRGAFGKLFTTTDPYVRGKAFETVMNDLFEFEGISIRKAFSLAVDDLGIVEQIDGVVEIDGVLYLVEAKWWSGKLGPGDIAQHMVRVYSRGHVRGIFIVEPGYTDAAVLSVANSLNQALFVLATISEFYQMFAAEESIMHWLKRKIQIAQIDRNPLHIEVPPPKGD
jgi:restriction system protein